MLSKTKSRTAGKNSKTTIITALLLLATVSGAVAQEKYDFAVVFHYPGMTKSAITIIKSNEPTQTVETNLKVLDFFGLLQQTTIQASKLTDEGWELINVSDSGWYFKRKKKQ